ncbi:MAG: hypothetical protein AAF677_10120 [Pseudomonadota bacterium]
MPETSAAWAAFQATVDGVYFTDPDPDPDPDPDRDPDTDPDPGTNPGPDLRRSRTAFALAHGHALGRLAALRDRNGVAGDTTLLPCLELALVDAIERRFDGDARVLRAATGATRGEHDEDVLALFGVDAARADAAAEALFAALAPNRP